MESLESKKIKFLVLKNEIPCNRKESSERFERDLFNEQWESYLNKRGDYSK